MREASRGFLLVVIIQLNVSDTERDSERMIFFKWHTVHPHQSTRQSAQTSPSFEISLLLFMWKLTAENHLLAEHEHSTVIYCINNVYIVFLINVVTLIEKSAFLSKMRKFLSDLNLFSGSVYIVKHKRNRYQNHAFSNVCSCHFHY